jgi:hypothetical protein
MRILRSAMQALVLLIVLLPLYPRVLPYYESAVLSGARFFLKTSPGDLRVDRLPDGGWLVASGDRPGGRVSLALGNRRFAMLALEGLLITTCLLLATPVPWHRRAVLCVLGIVCLMVVTSGSVAVSAGALARWCSADTGGRMCRNLAGVLSPWSHVICFAVWMGVAGPSWLRAEAREREGMRPHSGHH